MQKLLYSIRDAASILSLSKSGLYYLIATGHLKPRRIGGRTLLHYKELERFAARDLVAPVRPRTKKEPQE